MFQVMRRCLMRHPQQRSRSDKHISLMSLQPNLQRENTLVAASRGFVETILTDDEVAIHRIARIISEDEERQNTYELNRRFIESLPPVGPDPVIRWINAFSE